MLSFYIYIYMCVCLDRWIEMAAPNACDIIETLLYTYKPIYYYEYNGIIRCDLIFLNIYTH